MLKYFPKFSDFGRQKYRLCSRLEKEQSESRVGKKPRQNSAVTATPPTSGASSPPQWGLPPTSWPCVFLFSYHLTLLSICSTSGSYPKDGLKLLKLFLRQSLLHLGGGMKILAWGFSHCDHVGKFLVFIVFVGKSQYISNCLLSLDSRMTQFLTL